MSGACLQHEYKINESIVAQHVYNVSNQSNRNCLELSTFSVVNMVKCSNKEEMKIFQLIHENLSIFGSPENPFEKRNLWTLFEFSLGISFACAYFVCNAKTFIEYANSVYMIIAHTGAAIIYGIVAWRVHRILHYFVKAQKIIGGSEFFAEFVLFDLRFI